MMPCGSLRTAPSHQGTSPAPGVGRWGCLDVWSWRERWSRSLAPAEANRGRRHAMARRALEGGTQGITLAPGEQQGRG
jgi:hypothetical protein